MSAFRDVVAKHRVDSDAILVAAREPCISIAHDEEQTVTSRAFRVIPSEALTGLKLRDSWIMAVLLCPGEDTAAVAAWARREKRDPRRVIFYFHARTNPRQALAPWHRAGLPVHATWTITNWRDLHKHFGAAWNVRVFDDFRRL